MSSFSLLATHCFHFSFGVDLRMVTAFLKSSSESMSSISSLNSKKTRDVLA